MYAHPPSPAVPQCHARRSFRIKSWPTTTRQAAGSLSSRRRGIPSLGVSSPSAACRRIRMGLVPRIKVVVDVEVPGNLYPRAAITVDHSQVSIISGLLLSQPDWIDAVRYLYQIMKKKRLLVAKCRRYLNIKNDAGSGPSFPPMPGLFFGGGVGTYWWVCLYRNMLDDRNRFICTASMGQMARNLRRWRSWGVTLWRPSRALSLSIPRKTCWRAPTLAVGSTYFGDRFRYIPPP